VGRGETASVAGALIVSSLLTTQSGLAQQVERCGSEDRPWISVAFAGSVWERRARAEVIEDLRAGFRREQIDVCLRPSGPSRPAAAVITLRVSESANLWVTIELQDAVTQKRVERNVSLARIPEDGRPLATAIATDELLRASWAEVALDTHHPSRAEPPQEVRAAVRRVLPKTSGSSSKRVTSRIGSRAALEQYDRQTQLGLDVFFRPRISGRWGGEIALGLRDGLAESSRNGRIDASANAASVGGWVSLLQAVVFTLDLDLGVRASHVAFTADPSGSANGREVSGWTVYGRAGLSPSLRIVEPLRLGGTLGLGAPLKTLSASDDSEFVTGVRGLELFASLGVTVDL
jgi:hypothetical protein